MNKPSHPNKQYIYTEYTPQYTSLHHVYIVSHVHVEKNKNIYMLDSWLQRKHALLTQMLLGHKGKGAL